MTEYRKIMVATDFSASSQRAVDFGAELASSLGAELILLHSYDIPTYGLPALSARTSELERAVEEDARSRLEASVSALRARVPNAQAKLRKGTAWEQIQQALEETQADLLVIGTHGRTGMPRALLGSVAEKTVRLSKVPVITLRGADAAP